MKRSLAAQPGSFALGPLLESELAAAQDALARRDGESLHDLRVALRRLAVLVEQLSQPDKHHKSLLRDIKGLLKQSNRGRDVQVMLAWLNGQWPRLTEQERIGAELWRYRLKHQQERQRLSSKKVCTVLRHMVRTIASLSLPPEAAGMPLGIWLAQSLERQSNELVALLDSEGGANQIHTIRLQAKTVRYLLLPLSEELGACAEAESALRQLQTIAGDWHDAMLCQPLLYKLLQREVKALTTKRDVTVKEVAERAPALPGLIALAQANAQGLQRQVSNIKRTYLHKHAHALATLLQRATAELRMAATGQG